ncbi:MAG: DNA polymerase III subunit delta [Candidatus Zixiibacteriota bacterium]
MKRAEKKKISRAYLFSGEEEFQKRETLDRLIQLLIPPSHKSFNLDILHASRSSTVEIINKTSTFPLGTEKRLIIVYDIDKLTPSDKNLLIPHLKGIPESSCLILVTAGSDKRKKFFLDLEKTITVVDFPKLYENQIPSWITNRVKGYGKSIKKEAIQVLQSWAGKSLPDLANEIEKLLIFVGDKNTITSEDVKQVAGYTGTNDIFQLLNSVGHKNTKQALEILNNLFFYSHPTGTIIHWLTEHLIRLLKIKEFDYKKSEIPLTSYLRNHNYFLKDNKEQSKNFNREQLQNGFLLLYQADMDLKTSFLPSDLILELLVYNLCHL